MDTLVEPFAERRRHLHREPPAHLRRPVVRLQPVLAKEGKPNIDLPALAERTRGIAEVLPPIPIRSSEHWREVVLGLGPEVDAIIPVSIASYPTEIWNSHPQPLAERGLPVVFWPIIAYDEPDFWRWSARDMLRALGVEVHLVQDQREGIALLRALGMRRFLRDSRMVVIGAQNFPWNADAAGHLVTRSLGTGILVRPLEDMRARYDAVRDDAVDAVWEERRHRYDVQGTKPEWLRQAIVSYLAVRGMLEEERAFGFGVNCFGDLITGGGRDVPCLAQTLLREDGYIASCDGDFLAMMGMALSTYFLDKPCVMSNMYPVRYVGALEDHFGDPLAPAARFPREDWPNLARLGHCGFVGVVSPEMDPRGRVTLRDWGGTYEIPRDGRGCGVDGELAGGEQATVVELRFDGRTFLIAGCEVCETTRHARMPHCESTALLRFRDLPALVRDISREHIVLVYGDHVRDYEILAGVLGLEPRVY